MDLVKSPARDVGELLARMEQNLAEHACHLHRRMKGAIVVETDDLLATDLPGNPQRRQRGDDLRVRPSWKGRNRMSLTAAPPSRDRFGTVRTGTQVMLLQLIAGV